MVVPRRNVHDAITGATEPCPCCGKGDRSYRDWHKAKGPAPLLRARHGVPEYERPARWCDHFYRVIDSSTGETVYVAEPYQLDGKAFEDFVFLREQGWNVEVTARYARHAPGLSVAVMIWQAESGGA